MSCTKMSKHISKIRHLFYVSYISVSSKPIYIYIYKHGREMETYRPHEIPFPFVFCIAFFFNRQVWEYKMLHSCFCT